MNGTFLRDALLSFLWFGFLGATAAALFFIAVFAGSPFQVALFDWDTAMGSVVLGGPPGAVTGIVMAALADFAPLKRRHLIGLSPFVGFMVPPAVYAATYWHQWIDVVPIQIPVIGTLGAILTILGTAIALRLRLLRPPAEVAP